MSDERCIHELAPGTCSICNHGVAPRTVLTTMKITQCQSCEADVFWGVNPKTNKRNPIDAEPVQGGNIRIDGWAADGTPYLVYGARGSGPYVSHFSTCPDGPGWRRH